MLKAVTYTMGLAACLIAPTSAAEWMTEPEEALRQAAQENKAVLINFTGSDWCGYCIRMKKTVLDQPEFADYAANKFVLVEVDIPRKPLPPEVRSRREQLCRQYGVSGFPTFLVLSADGDILGGFSGALPDVESTEAVLDIALARGEQLKAARRLEGVERAKALFEIYKDFPRNYKIALNALHEEITRFDPEDTLGIREQVAADRQMQELMDEVRAYHRNFQKQTEIFEIYLQKAHPLNKERIMERKRSVVVFPCLNAMLYHAKTIEDIIAARDYVLKEAEISYPDSIKSEMIRSLQETFADPEAMLKKVQDMRKKR